MKLRNTLFGTAALVLAVTAQAETACNVMDISPVAQACQGFFGNNLLNSNPDNVTAQKDALALLGFNWDGNFNTVEKLDMLNGSKTVDFATLLQGISYVAFHYGAGQMGPGNATAFYRLDAGAGVDKIFLTYNASSNAVLYSTQVTAVPEPQTYALLLAGLGVMSFIAMRRKKS